MGLYHLAVFRIRVEDEFCAAHALVIGGVREPVHGHNWRVEAVVEGPELDADGLLCDFHAVERALRAVIDPLRNADLNSVAAMEGLNPSAEVVAQRICRRLADALTGVLGPGIRVAQVSVTEAPGCRAEYRVEP